MRSNNFMVVQSINPISLLHNPYHQHHSQQEDEHRTNNIRIKSNSQNNNNIVEQLQLGRIVPIKFKENLNGYGLKSHSSNDLFKCMRSFLIFGKLIGVVPISGVFHGNLDQLVFRKCSMSSLLSLLIILILSCNTTLALAGFFRTGGADATQLAKNLAASVCYGMGLYVFIYMFRNMKTFLLLLHKWKDLELLQEQEYEDGEDRKLRRCINIIAGAILASAISENAISHLLLFPLHDHVNNPLQYYYENSHKPWALMIPYHWSAAIGVFLCNKWAVYAWNFGDIFIVIISRALYGRFKGFVKVADEKLRKLEKGKSTYWENAIRDHDKLCKLTEEFSDMLSPLLFTSFVVNIYFICIQLHIFLAPSKRQDFISSLYGSWSFLHLLARTFAVALTAAKIHDYANEFGKLLRDCPRESYTIEVERAERKLSTYPTALHGLGAFHITRPFILSVISVIFTFEIVLLQTTMASLSSEET